MSLLKQIIIIIFTTIGVIYNTNYATDLNTYLQEITNNQCEKKQFIVTAYYSPIANQLFYVRGNEKDEKILNGEGKFGASGKEVFDGMLAAPQKYSFGGGIYFPNLGLGKIHDRGGAIVEAGEDGMLHDRVDVRMGFGEEGLIKALAFGKKTLTGIYCSDANLLTKKIPMGIAKDPIPTYKNFFDVTLWRNTLAIGRKDPRVRTLQKYLIRLGYLGITDQSGLFDKKTENAICSYQINKKILSPGNERCGYFGIHTRNTMYRELLAKGLLPSNLVEIGSLHDIRKFAQRVMQLTEKTYTAIAQKPTTNATEQIKITKISRAYKKGEIHKEIAYLQKFLKDKKFYNGPIDGIYSNKTIEGVYKFQIETKLVSDNPRDKLAWGYLGPQTREKINSMF